MFFWRCFRCGQLIADGDKLPDGPCRGIDKFMHGWWKERFGEGRYIQVKPIEDRWT